MPRKIQRCRVSRSSQQSRRIFPAQRDYLLADSLHPKLLLSALNSSRSAYASFTLEKSAFFEKYTYGLRSESEEEGRFTCQLYNKVSHSEECLTSLLTQWQALLSVFKGRLGDRRDNDTAIERCDVSIPHELERSESRIIVKMVCRHGTPVD